MCRRLADRDEPAVVADVEPLVGVGRPGIGAVHALDQVAQRGDAAAHSPNAPSTCSQAFGRVASASAIGPSGSNAPLFTLPACGATIGGPSMAGAPPRLRCPSGPGRRSRCASPAPARAHVLERGQHGGMRLLADEDLDRRGVVQALRASTSQPTRPAARGGRRPYRPCSPARRRSAGRSSASAGRPSSSSIHSPATCSAAAAAGESACVAAFWSHAVVSQSAASDAGSAPPTTKPK